MLGFWLNLFLFFCQALCYPLLGKATSATEGKALWMKMQSRNCHTDTNKISRESCRYFNTPIPTSTNSKNSLYLKKNMQELRYCQPDTSETLALMTNFKHLIALFQHLEHTMTYIFHRTYTFFHPLTISVQ